MRCSSFSDVMVWMTERYDCDQCGAFCKGTLIVEADWYDLEREPKIEDADPNYRDKTLDEARDQLSDGMRVILMACGTDRPCPMLGEDNRCDIYPTRPTVVSAWRLVMINARPHGNAWACNR